MNKLDITIRAFVAADVGAVHKVRLAAFAPVFASFRELVGADIADFIYLDVEEQQGVWLDKVCAPDSGHHVHVAVTREQVIGFCDHTLDKRTWIGEIGLNAVHPDFAGRGVGTALYDHAIEAMREAGMKVATVSTGGDPSHAPARAAYSKAGFNASVPSVQLNRTI